MRGRLDLGREKHARGRTAAFDMLLEPGRIGWPAGAIHCHQTPGPAPATKGGLPLNAPETRHKNSDHLWLQSMAYGLDVPADDGWRKAERCEKRQRANREAAIRARVCMKLIQKTSPPKDRPLHSAKKPRSAKSWRQDFLHGKASPKPLARGACGGSHSCFVVANSGFPLVPEDIFTPLACREKVVVLGRTVYPSYSFLAVQTE